MKNCILKLACMGGILISGCFALSGCTVSDDINVRVDDDYVQWQINGEGWNDLISIDEVKEILEDGVQGEQGVPGIDGKEVEFRKSSTHIQWRYVGDNVWIDLISISELEGEKGFNGNDGKDGVDGLTPHIGGNYNWWIGSQDTGIKAKGVDFKNIQEIVPVECDSNDPKYYDKFLIKFMDGTPDQTLYVKQNLFNIKYKYTSPSFLDYDFLSNSIGYQEIENFTFTDEVSVAGKSIAENLQTFSNTSLEKYLKGWYIKDTDIEINQYSVIGCDLTLEPRWDEENMEKYFYHGITDFKFSTSLGIEEVDHYTAYIDPENYHYVVVPEFYDDGIHGELPVYRVAREQFSDKDEVLMEIYMPHIKYIDDLTFANCVNLKRIAPYDELLVVGTKAFYGCTSLYFFRIEKNTEYIGDYAFEGCTNLTDIYISNQVILDSFTSNDSCCGLFSNAVEIMINPDLDLNNAEYLKSNYEEKGVTLSNHIEYIRYVKK